MPINATPQYQKAEEEYALARTSEEKLRVLQKMLMLAPKHKGAEPLLAEIKSKISKCKKSLDKEKKSKKGGFSLSIKKEGAAQVYIVGTTNSGKSTLLKRITNANPLIAEYEFTTTKPEIGIMDYGGVQIQVIELPAIVENYTNTENGPMYLGLIRQADLLIICGDHKLVLDELMKADIDRNYLIYKNDENIKDMIWNRLGIIRVFTKQPGKKPSVKPIALKKGDTIREMAEYIHKDFIKRFRFARVWGKSVKHKAQTVGINHILSDEDIVELHMG